MNGVQIGPNSKKNIDALKKADWLVVGEIYPDETSEFWRAPGTTPSEMKAIQTTVYRLPCAGFAEKDGTFVNSARWLQWKNVAVPPPGDAQARSGNPGADLPAGSRALSEGWRRVSRSDPEPALDLHAARCTRRSPRWRRRSTARRSPTSPIRRGQHDQGGPAAARLRRAERRRHDAVRQLAVLRIVDRGGHQAAAPRHRRSVGARHLSELGVVVAGEPARHVQPRVVRSGGQAVGRRSGGRSGGTRRQARWVGNDVPDFKADSTPKDHMGPFIMNPEGVGRMFGPLAAFADGPFPEHYEPIESPIANPLHPTAVEQSGREEDARRRSTSTATPSRDSTSSARPTG